MSQENQEETYTEEFNETKNQEMKETNIESNHIEEKPQEDHEDYPDDAQPEEDEPNPLTEEDIKTEFQKYDSEGKGFIPLEVVTKVLEALNIKNEGDLYSQISNELQGQGEQELVAYENFLEVLKSKVRVEEGDSIEKIQDYLRLLNEYRMRCENEGNFTEANRALAKYEELRKREQEKCEETIKSNQGEELRYLEDLHKKQFLDFSEAWDQYMKEYEETAYKSLEALKTRHKKDYEEQSARIREATRKKLKFSKEVIELRHKLEQLARQKRYEEAEKVKKVLEKLEEEDRDKLQKEFEEVVERKEALIKQKQQLELQAMLKRIQRDRNEQIKHRQSESHKLLKRNNNIKNDLLQRQRLEYQKTVEENRLKMGMSAKDGMNSTFN